LADWLRSQFSEQAAEVLRLNPSTLNLASLNGIKLTAILCADVHGYGRS
jgi:hypothetical protein